MGYIILAAIADNGTIGLQNTLPWNIPEDLKRFKRLTLDHTVIMGRKTYQSILNKLSNPLPKRKNIVLSNHRYKDERVVVAHSLEEVNKHCNELEENFVIGGENIFRLFLPHAERMELTHVRGNYEGDAFFPEVNWNEWQTRMRADKNMQGYEFSFVQYIRK